MAERDPTFWTRLAIAALAPSVLAAGILYFVLDSRSERAARDLEAFRQFATTEARKAQGASWPPYIAPMLAASISPAHHERLEMMQANYLSLRYRRGLTGGFSFGGAMLVLALGAFWMFIRKSRPNQLRHGGAVQREAERKSTT